MLVRASTLKMIRLQLAMERRDRRVALAEVDDLLALDRRLQDYLGDVPAAGEQALWRRELDAERAALNQEKLTLAAEVLRRPVHPVAQTDPVEPDDDWLGPRDQLSEQTASRAPHSSRWWLAVIPIVAAGLAAAAYFTDAAAWLTAAAGAVR